MAVKYGEQPAGLGETKMAVENSDILCNCLAELLNACCLIALGNYMAAGWGIAEDWWRGNHTGKITYL